MLKNISFSDIEAYISYKDEKTFVAYSLSTSYPCINFRKNIEKLKNKYNTTKFLNIEVDDEKCFSKENNIANYPVMLIYKYGILKKKYEGYLNENEIEELLKTIY